MGEIEAPKVYFVLHFNVYIDKFFSVRKYVYIYIYIYIYTCVNMCICTPPMKMEQKECFETAGHKIQTPGNHPPKRKQHSEHGDIFQLSTCTN
jgi:hypothetical protein